jgi:hypothetical protein
LESPLESSRIFEINWNFGRSFQIEAIEHRGTSGEVLDQRSNQVQEFFAQRPISVGTAVNLSGPNGRELLHALPLEIGISPINWRGRSVTHRAVYSFLRFELFDECSKARGDGSCDSVVLILEALSNRRQRNTSIASGIELALRGMRPATILSDMPTNPTLCHLAR